MMPHPYAYEREIQDIFRALLLWQFYLADNRLEGQIHVADLGEPRPAAEKVAAILGVTPKYVELPFRALFHPPPDESTFDRVFSWNSTRYRLSCGNGLCLAAINKEYAKACEELGRAATINQAGAAHNHLWGLIDGIQGYWDYAARKLFQAETAEANAEQESRIKYARQLAENAPLVMCGLPLKHESLVTTYDEVVSLILDLFSGELKNDAPATIPPSRLKPIVIGILLLVATGTLSGIVSTIAGFITKSVIDQYFGR